MNRRSLCVAAVLIIAWVAASIPSAYSGSADGSLTAAAGEAAQSEDVAARVRWFKRSRAYPNAEIPAGAYLNAYHQREAMLRSAAAARRYVSALNIKWATTPSDGVWKLIGPEPSVAGLGSAAPQQYSGKVDDIAVDPTNGNTVYIGTDSGGVWKSTDAGAHWTALTDNTPLLGIGAIAVDPSNPQVIYAGTGGDFGFYVAAGIIKSTDGGATWTDIQGAFAAAGRTLFRQLAVDPYVGSNVLAATDHGLFRSTDAGMTWALSGPQIIVDSVAFDRKVAGVAYATRSFFGDPSAGLYKSTDSGATWSQIGATGPNALPASQYLHPRVVIDPSNSSTLYVQMVLTDFSNTTANGAIYRSSDGGNNWVAINIPPLCCQTYSNLLAVNPLNPNILYAGNISLYRSMDAGVTWSVMDGSTGGSQVVLHSDQHAIAFTPDGSVMYDGTDGGVYSTNGAACATYDWLNLNATLSTIMFYPGLSIDPGNPQNSFAGTQDNGTQHFTGALPWGITFSCGDGGYTVIDSSNSNNVFIACASRVSIYKSSAGGADGTFVPAQIGIDTTDRFTLAPPLVADPAQPQTLYYGTYRVYQSRDGAASWNAISADLTAGLPGTNHVTTIAVAPSDSNTVYAGIDGPKVQVTTNASAGTGAAWQDITGDLTVLSPGMSTGTINVIAVDPTSASTAYVGFSGFANTRHVATTTDMGATWKDISGNLPDTPVDAIVVDPDVPNTLFVGTDVGTYWTADNGATWQVLGQGLPNAMVFSLALHRASRTLRAATFGRSAWDLTLPPLGPPVTASTTSVAFGSQNVQTASATQTITLRNNRRTPVTINSVTPTGDFAASNTCGAPIPVAGTCTISVSFTPTAAGARSGTVTVVANGIQQAIALSGIGTITLWMSASRASVTVGEPTTLTWNSPSVAVCNGAGGGNGDSWASAKPASGTASIAEAASGTYTYTLTCVAGSQTVKAQASVTVTMPSVTMAASSTTITTGQSVTLNWSSSNASACSASGGSSGDGWNGSKRQSGSAIVTETLAGNDTFVLTCTAASQASSARVSVNVNAAPASSSGGGGLDSIDLLLLGIGALLRWAKSRPSHRA